LCVKELPKTVKKLGESFFKSWAPKITPIKSKWFFRKCAWKKEGRTFLIGKNFRKNQNGNKEGMERSSKEYNLFGTLPWAIPKEWN